MDWDARYRNNDKPWDKGYASPAVAEILQRFDLDGSIWVPGTGLGHDARFLAKSLPDSQVTGIDISETALKQAQALENPQNLNFQKADIFALDPEATCDVWFEHTCYCAIYPSLRSDYKNAALRHIKRGGLLAGVFFASGSKDPNEGPPFFSTEAEILERFSEGFKLLDSWEPRKNYAGREGEERVFVFQRQF